MSDLSRFYYKDIPVLLISLFDIESNKILLFQVTLNLIIYRNIQY